MLLPTPYTAVWAQTWQYIKTVGYETNAIILKQDGFICVGFPLGNILMTVLKTFSWRHWQHPSSLPLNVLYLALSRCSISICLVINHKSSPSVARFFLTKAAARAWEDSEPHCNWWLKLVKRLRLLSVLCNDFWSHRGHWLDLMANVDVRWGWMLLGKICLATLYDCVLEPVGAGPSESVRQGVRMMGIILVH